MAQRARQAVDARISPETLKAAHERARAGTASRYGETAEDRLRNLHDGARTSFDKKAAEARWRRDRKPNDGEKLSRMLARPVEMIELAKILPDPRFKNARIAVEDDSLRSLADSMQGEGLVVPVVLVATSAAGDRFHVRAGFRRTAAARMLGWTEIPALVMPHDLPVVEDAWLNLAENLQRQNLSTYEIAVAAKTMRDQYGTTTAEFAYRSGYAAVTIEQYVRALTKLPAEVLEGWRLRKVPAQMCIQWSGLYPDEAIRQMRVYQHLYPKLIGDWRPPDRRKIPIKMASAAGLRRMKRLRDAVEVCPTLTEKEQRLCLEVVDFCSGGRQTVTGVHDADSKRRLRVARSNRRQDRESPGPDYEAAIEGAELLERVEAGEKEALDEVESFRSLLRSVPGMETLSELEGSDVVEMMARTWEQAKKLKNPSEPMTTEMIVQAVELAGIRPGQVDRPSADEQLAQLEQLVLEQSGQTSLDPRTDRK
jgi:ParB/RepB/Spo0J family partition protein